MEKTKGIHRLESVRKFGKNPPSLLKTQKEILKTKTYKK